ncbi:hypothetical protein [Meiothermus sp.]|uniref:hypothetical protein n=1 Tax=Meiothermus sp. TaxID=1955249 RepID=UPI0021DC0C5B|nr:hypothetical protein [Meiothermus sp.]GIW32850.1 MAG: hypothetical protein KatS3mg072_0183 [Meiothermus sp.]
MINPGTLKLRIGGLLQSKLGGESARGIVRTLSTKSRSRLLELTRELEAADIYPKLMITLTYPRDWEGAISPEHAEALWQFRRAWGLMNAHRYRPKGPGWAERWAELRPRCERGLGDCARWGRTAKK